MMLLSGLGMGLVFDGYRVISNELRFSRWWIPVLDLLYWTAATIIVFRVLFESNDGEVRAYVFLGLLIGICCYFWLFSRPVIALVRWLIRAVRKMLHIGASIFELVIIKPLFLIYRLARVILGFLAALTIFLFKIVLQLTRPLWLLLGWLLGPVLRPLGRLLAPVAVWWDKGKRVRAVGGFFSRLWKRWF